MPHLKRYKSGYKPPSLRYTRSEIELTNIADAYLDWLAQQHGWTADDVPCLYCNGAGYTTYGSYRRKRDCPECYGRGRCTVDKPPPDRERARAYVEDQRHELDRIAEYAVEGLKHRLFWHGFRPYIARAPLPETVEDYAARETERAALQVAMKTAFANMSDDAAYRAGDALRSQLYRFGTVDETRWYLPGARASEQCVALVYVGVRGPRRGYDYVKPDISIIIAPGRAPSATELDDIVAEAIAGLSSADLPLAA